MARRDPDEPNVLRGRHLAGLARGGRPGIAAAGPGVPWPPRRSSRLAKKACSRLPTVAEAQNMLMRKFDMASISHVETADFDRYMHPAIRQRSH
jgi:hypothetical protein